MLNYNRRPNRILKVENGLQIESFISGNEENIDSASVKSFGEEWSKFHSFSSAEIKKAGDEYFDLIDQSIVNEKTLALDVGCGTGRWSKYLAPRVQFVEALDPSDAVYAASRFTREIDNIRVTHASVDNIPFDDASFDLVFSLGVLHHIPDTQKAMQQAVQKLKPGGYFLVYLYYALDGRGLAFKALFALSTLLRKFISILPSFLKRLACDFIAVAIYLPFITLAFFLKVIGSRPRLWKRIPLSYYVGKSWTIIRNDSLDRFGTPLEQRFTKQEVINMMSRSGLSQIKVSDGEPYWHAIGRR